MSRRSPELDNPLERLYNGFTEAAAAALDNRSRDRNETVRDLARDLLYPCLGTPSTIAAEVVASQLDPRNVTLEAEYYGEMDERKFYEVKPCSGCGAFSTCRRPATTPDWGWISEGCSPRGSSEDAVPTLRSSKTSHSLSDTTSTAGTE